MRSWAISVWRSLKCIFTPFAGLWGGLMDVVAVLVFFGVGIAYFGEWLPGDVIGKVTFGLLLLWLLTFVALVRSQREIYHFKNDRGLKIDAAIGSGSSSRIILERGTHPTLKVNLLLQFINEASVIIGLTDKSAELYKKRFRRSRAIRLPASIVQWTRYPITDHASIMAAIEIPEHENTEYIDFLICFSLGTLPIGKLLTTKPKIRISIKTTYLEQPYVLVVHPNWSAIKKQKMNHRTIHKVVRKNL